MLCNFRSASDGPTVGVGLAVADRIDGREEACEVDGLEDAGTDDGL